MIAATLQAFEDALAHHRADPHNAGTRMALQAARAALRAEIDAAREAVKAASARAAAIHERTPPRWVPVKDRRGRVTNRVRTPHPDAGPAKADLLAAVKEDRAASVAAIVLARNP